MTAKKPASANGGTPVVDLLTDQPLIAVPESDKPLMGDLQSSPNENRAVKDSIMSLYNVQPSYTSHGHQAIGM